MVQSFSRLMNRGPLSWLPARADLGIVMRFQCVLSPCTDSSVSLPVADAVGARGLATTSAILASIDASASASN